MVDNYIGKTNRQAWGDGDMKLAIEAVKSGKMGCLAASKRFNVLQATLRRPAQGKNKRVVGIKKGLGRFFETFTPEQEQEIVEYLNLLEIGMFGLTTTDLRKIAFQFAEANKVQHRFNKNTQMAGWDWVKGFRERHPNISLRVPEATSAARAQAFNKPQIERFFQLLGRTIEEFGIKPERMFNMDESGLSTVQKPQRVFATKGRKQGGGITSAERGTHTTVVCSMNPIGSYVPPTLIFARKRFKQELIDDAPTRTLGLCQESGWMTGPLFLEWLKHFAKFTNASMDHKVLLICDGHSSHKFYDALVYAKQNGIIMLCTPPHCTHRVQPLDVSFFGPLSTYYNQEITMWLKQNPGRVVTCYQVGKLFSNAYQRAATMSNAVNGFAKTGIFPLNPEIFPDWMFAPSDPTDLPQPEEEGIKDVQINAAEGRTTVTPPPQEDYRNLDSITLHACNSNNNQESNVSLEEIAPLSKATASGTRKKGRKRQSACVLNSTPNMEELKMQIQTKKDKELRKSNRKRVKRVVLPEKSDSEEEPDPFENCDDDDDDVACIYCNERFKESLPNALWIRCQMCKMWYHNECAGVSKTIKNFICEVCMS